MTFAEFSRHLSKIEATPKRLEMTSLLAKLLKKAELEEVDKVVMLSLGRLAPLYKDIDFGLAEKTIVRSLASSSGLETKLVAESFKKVGDLGEVASELKQKTENRKPAFVSRSPLGTIRSRLTERFSAGKQRTVNRTSKLTVNDVFSRLLDIAGQTGEGSQERKITKTADLLRELDPLGAKYAVRIILQNLRLGFSDKTVLDALSVMIAGDKSAREKLEAAYNVRPDVGWLAKRVQSSEFRVQSLSDIKPQLGTPIMPALCQRLATAEEIIEKMRRVAVEPKWDGQRIQAHAWVQRPRAKGQGLKEADITVKLFTRSLEDVSEMFPDLVNAIKNLLRPLSLSPYPLALILDGEVVAVNPKTGRPLPFQTMITRKRKYGIQEKLADVPVRYMVFDILYLNGKSLMNEEFSQRRAVLEKLFYFQKTQKTRKTGVSETSENQKARDFGVPNLRFSDISGSPSIPSVLEIAPQLVTDDPVLIRKFLKQQINNGLEGIVAKRTDAAYISGRTQFAWVKLKWEGAAKSGGLVDTVDCVVMGTYAGRGKRVGFGVGAFLVGILNTEYRIPNSKKKQTTAHSEFSIQNSVFLTISKIGTGLTDEQWKELRAKGQGLRAKGKPKEYDVPKELTPDVWLKPELVVEIQADNITKSPLHTAGYALRFPRLVKYRNDKRPQQATTAEEVEELYKIQFISTHPRSWHKPQLPPR